MHAGCVGNKAERPNRKAAPRAYGGKAVQVAENKTNAQAGEVKGPALPGFMRPTACSLARQRGKAAAVC